MRKICSALLAVVLLASTLLAVPFSALAVADNTDTVYTNVDFTEAFYGLGSTAYNTESSIADLSVSGTTDADKAQGKAFAIKYLKVRNASRDDWPNGFYIADSTGNAAFQFKKGVTYKISYNLRRTKTLSAGIAVFMANGGTGNMAEIAPALAYHGGSAGTWALVTMEFTAPANGAYALAFYTQGYTMVTDSGVYIDDVTVTVDTTVNYGDSSITTTADKTYEEVLTYPADPYFEGYYLDDTTRATGAIDDVNVTVYPKYKTSTEVTFDEAVYVDADKTVASNGSLSYTYNNGVFTGNKLIVRYAELTTDPIENGTHGNVIKYTQINQLATGDANHQWAQAMRFANNNGTAVYTLEAGKKYSLTYDIYVQSAETEFDVYIALLGSSNGLSNVSMDFQHIKVASKVTVTDGWNTVNTSFYVPISSTKTYQPVLVLRRISADSGYYGNKSCNVYFDNLKIDRDGLSAPNEAGLFSHSDTEANEAAGITGTAEGSAVYTVGETEYAAFRVFGEYIAPAKADGSGVDYGKLVKADGTTVDIAKRHMMLGYKTTPTLEANYAMSTAEGDALANYWSVTPNADGTYTVRYSLLLKNIPEAYAGTAFNARGAIVTTEQETIYTNTQVDISAKALYNKAVAINTELKWFGGIAGAVE